VAENIKPFSVVKKFRDTHHRMAQLFAMGRRTGEVAEEMGYSVSRISILRNTPAFEELVEGYRKDVEASWRATVDEHFKAMVRVRNKAIRQMEDQMDSAEESGESIPIGTLLRIASDNSDRTGYPKRTEALTLSMDFASLLDRARSRSEKVKLIDVTPKPEAVATVGFNRRV
jgi:hypothetical protein